MHTPPPTNGEQLNFPPPWTQDNANVHGRVCMAVWAEANACTSDGDDGASSHRMRSPLENVAYPVVIVGDLPSLAGPR
ncbi:hypothetical protein G6O67_005841 [Ophiocordyceps sinensis]|uniref:Uncharacterized protein n=1 Tax=Ophiocordyceps sinensis TaxID=72228 RepID=A0A8H4PNG8_9HYPO|nr:hypothetical protein G6O67_005841 [Ophiocordyceps sinensis]